MKMFPCSLSTQDNGRAALLVRQSMTSLGTITPKVIARMIVKAIMPSATVAPKSCKLAFALLASSRRPLDILKRKTPGIIETTEAKPMAANGI